jgi:hypothetical protein
MTGLSGGTAGLRLPADVVQPFLLRFRRDDLHVMAFFNGHPRYEAVEAMIQHRPDDTSSIRAILTRHDQTQIDHVNDEELLQEARGVHRQTCFRDIDLSLGDSGDKRQARLAFTSHADEQIVLDLTSVGVPSPDRAGLTDPGGHSPTTSLPLMWRGASALAGPQTTVTVDGVDYEVPVRISRPSFVAHEGYYTEHHAMAVIRAGTTGLRLRSKPVLFDAGAAWVFENEGREAVYQIAARSADGQLTIANDAAGEIITGVMADDRLAIRQIRRVTGGAHKSGFTLSFGDDRSFRLSMDGAGDLVAGEVGVVDNADGCVISLVPVRPAWAVARRVTVTCSRSDGQLLAVTTIGPVA